MFSLDTGPELQTFIPIPDINYLMFERDLQLG